MTCLRFYTLETFIYTTKLWRTYPFDGGSCEHLSNISALVFFMKQWSHL